MRKLLFFALTVLFCTGMAVVFAQEPSPVLPPGNYRIGATSNFTPLSAREIIFVAGHSSLNQDIIDLINQHVAEELAAGKKRILILTELRDAFKAEEHQLAASDWALVLLGSTVLATGCFFLLKWLLSAKKTSSEKPSSSSTSSPSATTNTSTSDEWEEISLDSPSPDRPTFAGIDLDLDDRTPSKPRR